MGAVSVVFNNLVGAGDGREDGSFEDGEDSGPVQAWSPELGLQCLPRPRHRPQRLPAGLLNRQLRVRQLLIHR